MPIESATAPRPRGLAMQYVGCAPGSPQRGWSQSAHESAPTFSETACCMPTHRPYPGLSTHEKRRPWRRREHRREGTQRKMGAWLA